MTSGPDQELICVSCGRHFVGEVGLDVMCPDCKADSEL